MGIRIAVIDDGVSRHIVKDLAFDECVDSLKSDTPAAIDSHGSIVAAIIRHYVRVPIAIGSFKILHSRTHTGNINDLVHALCWCVDNQIDVVHLSLGVVSPQDFADLLQITKYAYSHGCIIIAACKNNSNYALPASSSYSIGVACSQLLEAGDYTVMPMPNAQIDFLASAKHTVTLSPDMEYTTAVCNSNAAPLITANVCNCIYGRDHYTLDSVKDMLKQRVGHHERYTRFYSVEPYDKTTICYIQTQAGHTADLVFEPQELDRFETFISECDTEIIGLIFDNETCQNERLVSSVAKIVFKYEKSISCLSHPFAPKEYLPVKRLYEPNQLFYHNDNGQKTDVPLLVFTGVGASRIASYISFQIQYIGYSSLLLSDYVTDFLHGFTYLHPAKRCNGVLADLVGFYNSELICAVLDPAIGDLDIEIDIHVRCDTGDSTDHDVLSNHTILYTGNPQECFRHIKSMLFED